MSSAKDALKSVLWKGSTDFETYEVALLGHLHETTRPLPLHDWFYVDNNLIHSHFFKQWIWGF